MNENNYQTALSNSFPNLKNYPPHERAAILRRYERNARLADSVIAEAAEKYRRQEIAELKRELKLMKARIDYITKVKQIMRE